MHRRAFLAAVAAAGLAGCSGPQPIASGTEQWSVPAGGYESLALDVRIPATIEYGVEVRDGPAVDVLVLREERFAEFEAGDLSETAPMSSLRGTEAGSANGNLMPGTWYIVVDNPGAGAAAVTVAYEVTQYIPYGSGRHDDSGP